MSSVIVIGGGAAGMMAAVFAARIGRQVRLLEKNEKLGKKLFITFRSWNARLYRSGRDLRLQSYTSLHPSQQNS